MATDSVVRAVFESLECRKTVLELSNRLELGNDPGLRTAMRADEERIATFLVSIFSSKAEEETVLRLEGDSAQHFLDVVQEMLDRGFLMKQEHTRMAFRTIRKLSELCDRLPSSLFIAGVNDRDEHACFAGGFGDIYRASYGDQRVALKRMRYFLRGSDLRRIHLKFCREALLWKDLHHPNILPFLGIDRDSFPSSLCMVSPWMEHGTVIDYLKTHGHANVDKLLYEIAQGLEYLHSHNIVHGDLRGGNILIQADWSACLADFGLSAFSDATSLVSTNRGGNPHWMAPELLHPARFGLTFVRTPATDVYAFGCVCFELYTEQPPFASLSDITALLMVLDGKRPERPLGPPVMSDTLWKHVTNCWAESPTTRPSTALVVHNMAWPRPVPPTTSALHTAGNLSRSTPPATNESAVVSTTEETAILEDESSIPSLVDAAESYSPFLHPAEDSPRQTMSSGTIMSGVSYDSDSEDDEGTSLKMPPAEHHKSIGERHKSNLRRGDRPALKVQTDLNRLIKVAHTQQQRHATFAPGLPPSPSQQFSQRPSSFLGVTFKWVRGELIGRGTYGRVYLALNTSTGEMIAVKEVEIPRTASKRSDSRQVTAVQALKLESETLKVLDHPNIVQFLGFEETPTNLRIFMEYVSGGSIRSCRLKYGRFDKDVTKSFTSQILAGLEYLHSKGILHRDLKSDNILVETTGECKISNFQMSKRTDDQNEAHTPMQSSVFWMAPEVLGTQKKGYSFKIDIWSAGCVVLEMWTGGRQWLEHLLHSKLPPVPDRLVPLADDFRKKCFAINPEERATAAELRRHPYLTLSPGWQFDGFAPKPSTM
ncbi:kinase-like domain-containing protein [Mycena galopus ATCC 62051]|nr:kinase-like domain-containing protein [Mycena galopus ATCC 62051]